MSPLGLINTPVMGDEKTTHIESTNPNAPGPKLLNSFLGLPLGYEFLILSCDYLNQRWKSLNGSKKGKSMVMRTALDVKRMEIWGKKFPTVEDEHIVIVKNRELTKSSLIENIKRFRLAPSAKVVYVGGHAIQTDDGFIYLPVDWASGMDYTQGITSNEMSELLIGASPQSTLTLILITDFCFSFNFLRLPYVLGMNPDGSFFWEESDEFEHGASWNDEHKILQFAGSEKSTPTYEFKSTASIFSLALYSCDPNEPKSLSERVRFMRNGITTFLGKYNERNNLPEGLRQDVQIYASHKWDLETPMALPDLISKSRPI